MPATRVRAAEEPAAAPAKHDDPQAAEARRHYEEGTKAFNLGEYPRAVSEFKAAYNAKPDPLLLYNIAQAYRLGSDAAQALFFYRSFLRNMPTATNRREVEGRIRTLEKQVQVQVEEQKRETATAPAGVAPAATTPGPSVAAPPGRSGAVGTTAAVGPAAVEPKPIESPGPASPRPSDTGATATPGTTAPSTTLPAVSPESQPTPTVVDLAAPPPSSERPPSRPIYKKWWFWTGAGVVLLLGLGIAASARDQVPSTTYGLHNPTFSAPPSAP